jgi:uncharacterized paraquat-inducible protein A
MAATGLEVGSYKPSPTKYTGPMDLANMRKNGARSLWVTCLDCHHHRTINVDALPGHLSVPSFTARMKCTRCSSQRVHVMPSWPKIGGGALMPHDPHFHDCPHCDGKANIPNGLGRAAFKCPRCGKVTPEARLRRLSMRRAPADDD